MPIYEYSCPKCGHFEAIQKITDEPLVAKPDCNCADCPKMAAREISASAFHLKGSGWYKTDYSSGSTTAGTAKTTKKTESNSTSDSTESKSAETKSTESKPAGSCGSGCGCH